MSGASYAISSFLGGEISSFAQGRFDKPDYRVSLNVCVNSFPAEIGPWVRRPGTQYASHSRSGGKGRTIRFDFQASNPITIEFTDGYVRFRNGATLITTNDAQVVVAVSSANPAVVQTTAAVTWATGDTLIFPGASTPLLENRQFTATKIDTTHFSLADALTGASINGATLGALVTGATVAKVHELTTNYIGGLWSGIRAVQAETTDILLAGSIAPQALTVTSLPSNLANPVFSISPALFTDGPYLDPLTNGAQLVPNATSGIVQLSVSFPTFSSTQAYANNAFITYSGNNYVSLQDQNVGNTPNSSPSFWATTPTAAAINNGKGFVSSDIGRLIRLFCEPAAWASGTTYASGDIVSYNPSGVAGANTYWQALVGSNTGNIPGADTSNWSLMTTEGAAVWTWGKITSLLNFVPAAPSSIAYIGTMTGNGGLSAAYNGVLSQADSASAIKQVTQVFSVGTSSFLYAHFVGQNFSSCTPNAYAVASATVYPSNDLGYMQVATSGSPNLGGNIQGELSIELWASNTAPSGYGAGKLLGSAVIGDMTLTGNSTVVKSGPPITISSGDQVTTFKYIWVSMICNFASNGNVTGTSLTVTGIVSQVQPTQAVTSSTSSGIKIEVLGAALLSSTNPITTWRLGVYSNTTGFPTCGIYNDGRLYLGGAVGNRFDACVSNGIVGGAVNFAPTDQYGAVSPSSAISYTFNSKGVNPILWMRPDLQGIKAGTQAGEWLIQAPTAGSISPLNITARQVTSHGSANVEPVDTEHTLVFVQRFSRKLLEYFPDIFSGKFSAPNLADKTVRTRAGVAELAYTSAVTPIIWGRDALGALFGITYKRDSLASSQPPTFYAWHGHTLGSGRLVESICAGPSVGGNLDALTMVTNDTSTSIRHVEVLTDTQDEQSALASSWFLDDAVNPTSTSTSNAAVTGAPYGGLTINGLWHLNGKTVQVFAGGLDCGDPGDNKTTFSDFVVANGSAFVPYGDGISAGSGRGLFTAAFAAALPLSQIVVGFTYNSDGQLVHPMSPADTGARNGPAFGKKSRIHRYAAKLANSLGLSFGTKFTKLFPGKFQDETGKAIAPLTTYSGIMQDTLQDDYGYEHGLCWRVSRPWPANIPAIGGNLETQDQ